MVCTTFLHSCEIDVPLEDRDVQDLLDTVRQRTGRNWQAVPTRTVVTRSLFKKSKTQLFGLYLYVGGIGPWQQINFYSSNENASSINVYVTLDVIAAYLMGILNGAGIYPDKHTNKPDISNELMADCMNMVRQELIDTGIIDKTVPPMMVADAVISKINAMQQQIESLKNPLNNKNL